MGNVVYYRRVNPALVSLLDAVVDKGLDPGKHEVVVMPSSESLVQIKALLDDVDRLSREVEEWKRRHAAAVEATQDQLAIYWKREFFKLKKAVEDKYGNE